ncbi:ABC transporter permease [Clostridium sp. AF50-3]|uniref:ABC transporter permease n=1 Tax=Clostridium sp. AF50-3 TaxID=2293021 RepID=UPI0026B91C63
MKFFIKKLITLIITLLVISFLTFTAFSVIPGDAALSRLGKDATEEQLERARDEMGLNDPLLERYGRWVTDAMQGDFGESYRYEGTSVRSLLAQRLPVTVLLAVISLFIITVISVPLGILSARFAGKWVDTLTNCLTQILMAMRHSFSA